MNVFKRIFKMGQAETHSALDKLENPIKLTEQGIRDLKKDLDESLKALAEVKAMAIRSRNDLQTSKNKAKDYENKAMLLLKKAQNGDIDAADADRLASEALVKKEEELEQATRSQEEVNRFEGNIGQLDQNVKKIRSTISKYENELKTLKARVKVSEATKKLNKQMAQIDSSSTVTMLERMKDKVAQDEALAESYGEIANESKSIDDEIDKALEGGENQAKASDSLAALKNKLGME
ncbi:PspA/IM30 family protein [Roseivirga sp.]|uniref:PspA/IM30 family protein n=1 Tax=Roseivirga sp. TaxID=1964215 RepID=UPI003B8DC3EF